MHVVQNSELLKNYKHQYYIMNTTYHIHKQITLGSYRISFDMIGRVATFVTIISLIAYIFFLATTTMHITARKELQNESREIQSQIADLEAHYLQARALVHRDDASRYNLTQTTEPLFVYRYTTTENLAFQVQ